MSSILDEFENLSEDYIQEIDDENDEEFKKARKEIVVSSKINLPFSAEEAFEAFSNLERQPSWSSWLKSVTYIDDKDDSTVERRFSNCGMELKETKWVMGWKKFRFSWKSKVTTLNRPHRIDWESTSGLKNMGSVQFEDIIRGLDDEEEDRDENGYLIKTRMTLSMKFIAPRIVASALRRSDKISYLMEDKMLQPTLDKFSQVVAEELRIVDKTDC